MPFYHYCCFLVYRHVIAPKLYLYDAKIVYQWRINLDTTQQRHQPQHLSPLDEDGSSFLLAHVDPTEAIHLTWTEQCRTGKWITDIRVPLAGTSLHGLAAHVRVRRQFSLSW